MKKILGLDLGTASIGWALINEASNEKEESSIIKLGVRIVPLSKDEKAEFAAGKKISLNAARTLKRSARRNLQRFKLRRTALIDELKNANLITNESVLTETGKQNRFETLQLRAKSATEKIALADLAKVLLMLNKKRGYKSSRKAKGEKDVGFLIDGMKVAKELFEKNLTPGQFVLELLKADENYIPSFYPSDLQHEFNLIWKTQKEFYPNELTDELKENLKEKNSKATWAICKASLNIEGLKQKGTQKAKKLEGFTWRAEALQQQLSLEKLVVVFQKINTELSASSGYLGAISDRSKALFFDKETIGQNLYRQVLNDSHTSLKNQIFYRQNYLDEFETIWTTQSKFHEVLTTELKIKIRDIIIFYQRPLKSQKGLIGKCELESREGYKMIDGKKTKAMLGPRVIPKSSFLFQEFKIWQNLNNLKLEHKDTGEIIKFPKPEDTLREFIFEELNLRGTLKTTEIVKLLNLKTPKKWKANFTEIEGNKTNELLYNCYQNIAEAEGYGFDWNKKTAAEIKEELVAIFPLIGIDKGILDFDTTLKGNDFDKQASYQFWHLLYASEDDKNISEEDRNSYGDNNVTLKKVLHKKYGIKLKYGNMLANIGFPKDHGNLSARAIKKILPHLKNGLIYSEACAAAGYNHSSSMTTEELATRPLLDKLKPLKKNSLRNPVVEKILSQMINVVNQIVDEYDKPDEIRVELARELKKSAKERANATTNINSAKKRHEEIRKILQTTPAFNIKNPTRNDIIKYKLFEELSSNCYKALYSDQQITKEQLFSQEIDIEHIIPKALTFDDSFSNKTLSFRSFNQEKGNSTALDYITNFRNNDLDAYLSRVKKLHDNNKISNAKYKKLTIAEEDLESGFIERDLRNSQYIAKKATELLKTTFRTVNTTSGSITAKLREDWDLINVMKELNFSKYQAAGLVEMEERKYGQIIEKIKDWSKRNDHRHHAMDALTVAFTTHSHVQYFNNKNAAQHSTNKILSAIQDKITAFYFSKNGSKKRRFIPPMSQFREEAKKHLAQILISFKAKNKVATINKNKYKIKSNVKIQKTLTPRISLHNETIYGKRKKAESKNIKINAKLNLETIMMVTKLDYRNLLLERLKEFDGNPKKAFAGKNSPSKNPIFLDVDKKVKLPDEIKIKYYTDEYTIRKPMSDFAAEKKDKINKKIEKVIDANIKNILKARLKEHDGDPKKAFGNLENNPIWLNQEKGISIKRVKITGASTVESLHDKKDHFGNEILNAQGKTQPVNFVNTSGNHHVAIYKDEKGKLQENVVSYFEAVARAIQGIPIIDKSWNADKGWEFLFTMKKNEMFVFPSENFDPFNMDLTDPKNYAAISKNLFRVQKIATKNYCFRHHLDTTVEDIKNLKEITWIIIQSTKRLASFQKVRINHTGKIVQIGEY